MDDFEVAPERHKDWRRAEKKCLTILSRFILAQPLGGRGEFSW